MQDAARLQSQQQWATDPLFDYTTLLLQADNAPNAAQNNTFLDSSANALTITRNGNTTQGTFTPFSATGWSNFFAGTGNYLVAGTSTNLALGAGDFTIEFWLYLLAYNPSTGITLDWRTAGSAPANIPVLPLSASGVPLFYANVSSGALIIGSSAIPLNTWTHLAVVRSGSTVTMYLNGTSIGSASDSTNLGIQTLNINDPQGAYGTNGYFSNIRIVKGTAVYTAAFTPPTSPLTAITNTQLLTCQSNRFRDVSTNNFTLTPSGTPSVQAFAPFAPQFQYTPTVIGGSGYFDGSGDSLSSATNFESATNISTFTIEGFVYPTTFSTLINVIGGMVVLSGDQKSLAAEVNTSGQVALYWFDGSVRRCTGNSVMQLNAWNYFAIVVTSNAIAIYVNKTTADTLSGTTTLTNRTQLTGLGVGAYFNNNAPAQYFNGYLANLRYSTVARTISAVPTAPFTPDTDARWLLNFTNAAITDGTMKNNLETVGNAQVSTSIVKYGAGSMAFDGSGDYVIARANTALAIGSGDFTVEGWVYSAVFPSSSNFQTIYTNGTTNTSAGAFSFGVDSTGKLYVYSNSAFRITTATNISLATWAHFAVVRSGTTVRIYINGTADANTWTSVTNNFSDGSLVVGVNPNTIAEFFNGYIDDLRITRFARYTANFTPPQVALPRQ